MLYISPLALAAAIAAAPTQAPTQAPSSPSVLLLGDSMMRIGVGPVLKRALDDKLDADITEHAKSATGLARPDSYDWPAALKKILVEQHFDSAVVYLGSNDCQALHDGNDDKTVAYGTPEWQTAYRLRVHDLLAQLCAGADAVFWLELPPMRSPRFNTKIMELNPLLEAEVKASACGHFVPLAAAVSGAKNSYVQYRKIGRHKRKIREDDGVHFTQHGGALVTEAVLQALAAPAKPVP